ncbi:MAG: hypothetical protein AB7U82_33650 [Blastocatellales bacterium]
MALARIEQFLRAASPEDFKSAEDFAEKLFEEVSDSYQAAWQSARAQRIVKRTIRDIYTFYRLRDDSLFGDQDSPVRVRFGGEDTRTAKFFGNTDHWYFSKYLNNSEPRIKQFLADEYIKQGGRRTFDMTPEQIEDIRAGMGDLLKDVNDVGVARIVNGSVTRARNWAHIRRLNEGLFELAKIVAVLDSRTSAICQFLDGKMLRVGAANKAVDRLSRLEPGEFAKEMYESDIAKGLQAANDKLEEVEKFFEGYVDSAGVLDDRLMTAGRGFPPYHLNCRTRVEGVFVDINTAPPSEPEKTGPETSGEDARKRLGEIEDDYRRQIGEADKLVDEKMDEWRSAKTGRERKQIERQIERIRKQEKPRKERRDEDMRQALFVSEPAKFDFEYSGRVNDQFKSLIERGIAYFRNFVGSDVLEGKKLKVFEDKRGRAYYLNGSIHINKRNGAEVVCHEIGHWLEESSPEILKKIVEFHDRRTANDQEERLIDLFPRARYARSEKTKKDAYLSAYMGKTYKTGQVITNTEILSSGLEWFYKDPLRLAEHDPEYFDLIYEVVRMMK